MPHAVKFPPKLRSVAIGDDIVVSVVEVRGDKVRLGVVLPKEMPVHRQEILENPSRTVAASDPGRRLADLARRCRPPPGQDHRREGGL